MTYVRTMICWASGMVEFMVHEKAPDGAIVCCTIQHPHDFEDLLRVVQEQAILHDFGDRIGFRIPGIDPGRPDLPGGIDYAVDILIRWEDDVREALVDGNQIVWTRS